MILKKLSIAMVTAIVLSLKTGITANATTLNFTDFSDLSSLSLNGSAKAINRIRPVFFNGQNVLRLTNNFNQSGSAFLTDRLSLADDASFSTAFSFQITNPQGAFDEDGQGADSIVFVVQNQSNNVGGAGGGIGYAGIKPSIGIEFDTWNNTINGINENGNHIGINLNGSIHSVIKKNVRTRMNNGAVWYSWVDYNGVSDLLEVRLSQTATRPDASFLSYTVDLASILGTPNAFIGFTSGTGGASGDHDIRSWTFRNSYNPIGIQQPASVPEPSSALGLLTFGALGIASMLKRKRQQKVLNSVATN